MQRKKKNKKSLYETKNQAITFARFHYLQLHNLNGSRIFITVEKKKTRNLI